MVIVGGMSFGTLLTLFVVPTVYTLVSRARGSATTPDTAGSVGAPDEGVEAIPVAAAAKAAH